MNIPSDQANTIGRGGYNCRLALQWQTVFQSASQFHSEEKTTDGFELSCCGFSKISRFLERILMEYIE